jgi:hypothetical protein
MSAAMAQEIQALETPMNRDRHMKISRLYPRGLRCLAGAAAALVLVLGTSQAWSQEWALYLAFDDLFSIDFPGEPAIRKTTYKTEDGNTLPANVYTAKDEFGTYSVTAVNWATAEAQQKVTYQNCMATTGNLRGGENPGICSPNRTRGEISGATLFAVGPFLRRDSKVQRFAQSPLDGVEGVGIELLNQDQSQTFVQIAWHEGFLYVAEATAPKGAPPPSAFPVSLQFIDKDGRRIRYDGRYSPAFPVPKRSR